jgi:hypothetical protein
MSLTIRSAQTIRNGLTLRGSSAIITAGLALYLDAGNVTSYPGTGTTWTDLIGSRAFNFIGSPTYSSANGGYINFNPNNGDYAQCNTSLSTLTTWTTEVWHYYDYGTTGQAPAILTEIYPGSGASLNYSLGENSANGTGLGIGFFDGNTTTWHSTPGYALPLGHWYHIVGTYDGTTLKLYINGTVVESIAASGTLASSNSGIRLMCRWDNPDLWGGRLGVVRIYNGDITQSGVTNNFNTERSRFGI